IEGRPPVALNALPLAYLMEVSPGFFNTLQARLVKGHDCTPTGPLQSPPVTVINEARARQYFAGQDPIGKGLMLGQLRLEIIGVVQDLQQVGPGGAETPEFFLSMRQGT